MIKKSICCKKCHFSYSNSSDILKDLLSVKKLSKRQNIYYEECLKNITFELSKGEKLGVIGLNGSGKSSLLLALSGNLHKTEGKLEVNDIYQLLFEMGDVDTPLKTGYEIIEAYYCMLISFQDSDQKLPTLDIYKKEVASFSELKENLDQKFLTYSSGMKARLLYSLRAVCINQYFLIDEILSVGDSYFTEKCTRNLRIRDFKSTGVYVSHDWTLLSKICSKFLWLENGEIIKYGKMKEVLASYLTKYNVYLQNTESVFKELTLEKNIFYISNSEKYLTFKFVYINAVILKSELSVAFENISSNKGWENVLSTSWTELKLKNKEIGTFEINIAKPYHLMPEEYELSLFFRWVDQNKIQKQFTYSWLNKKSFNFKLKK